MPLYMHSESLHATLHCSAALPVLLHVLPTPLLPLLPPQYPVQGVLAGQVDDELGG